MGREREDRTVIDSQESRGKVIKGFHSEGTEFYCGRDRMRMPPSLSLCSEWTVVGRKTAGRRGLEIVRESIQGQGCRR